MSGNPYLNAQNEWVFPAPVDNYQRPITMLTVSDVERLAKAGVKIEFEAIRDQIRPDDPTPPRYDAPRTLEDAFWERWKRANIRDDVNMGRMFPYKINASQHGDKVYVFVAPLDQPPFILEDVSVLYPSDALMAKLALLEKSK